jgi:hypothetical protein
MLFRQLVNRMCSQSLFPAYWKVVNGLLTTCYKVVEFNRVVTSCSNNLLSSCTSTICQQVVSDNLVATWWNNRIVITGWQACILLTSCEIFTCVHASQHRIVSPIFHNFHFRTIKHKNTRKLTSKNIWGESIPPILVQAVFTPRLIFLKHTKDNNKVKFITEF